jgi:hypothetical protein
MLTERKLNIMKVYNEKNQVAIALNIAKNNELKGANN